jgi:hypothetical protein
MRPRTARIVSWIAQGVAAVILAMAAIPKLTSQPEAVALFTTLGVEPWGRWLVGATEVLIILLLLWPRSVAYGGLLALALMTGAIGAHLFRLGIVYDGDVSLFLLASVVFVAAAVVVYLHRERLGIGRRP